MPSETTKLSCSKRSSPYCREQSWEHFKKRCQLRCKMQSLLAVSITVQTKHETSTSWGEDIKQQRITKATHFETFGLMNVRNVNRFSLSILAWFAVQLSDKTSEPYADVVGFIMTKVSFAWGVQSILCIRGCRSLKHAVTQTESSMSAIVEEGRLSSSQ